MSKESVALEHLMDGCCSNCPDEVCGTRKNGACPHFRNYKIIETALKALEIIKECFVLNGFDELIPNSKWFDEANQDLVKEALKE